MSEINDAAVEAGARALFEEMQELGQENSWDDPLPDEWREAWRDAARETLTAALPHLTPEPQGASVEEVARAIYAQEAQPICDEVSEQMVGFRPWGWITEEHRDYYLSRAGEIIALLPGRSEAEVKAEALSEAADWLLSIGYVADLTFDIAAPDALWEAFVDAAHQDKDGSLHGNTLTREEVDDWLSEEAGRLAADGGAS